MNSEKLARLKKNKPLIIGLASVVALTLFFALDSFVRHKRFDPRNQLEDYVEGRVTLERIAAVWSKKEETSSLTDRIESAFSTPADVQSGTEGSQSAGESTQSSGESNQFSGGGPPSSGEQAFLTRLQDDLAGCKRRELDGLTFSSPGVENREDFVKAIVDLCGHRFASVTIDHGSQAAVDMPVDSQGNKLQFVGTLIVEFASDDLPEFQMNTVTFHPKRWENPVGQTSDGTCYLIPVEEVIFKT